MKKMLKANCSDADSSITVPPEVINGEIVGCPCCGLEYEKKRRWIRENAHPQFSALSGTFKNPNM